MTEATQHRSALSVPHPLIFTPYARLVPSNPLQFSSVQFSCSVVSESLRPHELQHVTLPCPSPAPGVHSDSCASSLWCHPAISCSVVPFSSCPQSLPASESFPMCQLFTWGGQSTRVSALASGLSGSPCNPRDSQESSPTPQFKSINSLVLSLLHSPTLTSIHDHRKNHSLDYLGCFHFLAIVNSVAMNHGIHVSFFNLGFLRYMSRSGIAGSYDSFIPSCF